MNAVFPQIVFAAGIGQLCVLTASALVPIRLHWRREFKKLSALHRQLYWVYGGYVVLSIIALGLISAVNSTELTSGSLLARSVSLYIATFWGIRLTLQTVLEVRPHLTTWWLKAGYHGLTFLFAAFTLIFAWAALHPAV